MFKFIIKLKTIILKIKTTNDLWDWMIEDFAPKMRINKWYNGDDVDELGGFLTDFASRVIAFVKIRQLRVDNGIVFGLGQMI